MGQKFIIGLSWTFGSQLFDLVAGIIISIIVTRSLGPEGRGAMALLVLMSSISHILTYMNLSASTVYHLNHEKWEIKYTLRLVLLLTALIGLLAFIVMLALFKFWPDKNVKELPIIAVIIVAFSLFLSMFRSNIGAILSAMREFGLLNLSSIISGTIIIPCYWIILKKMNMGIVGWAFVGLIASSVGLIFTSVFVFYKVLHIPRSNFKDNNLSFIKRIIKILSFGIKSQIGNIAWFIVLKADQAIISKFLTLEAIGYYSVAVGLAEKLRLIPMSVGSVLFPFASQKSNEERCAFISKVLRLTLSVVVPLGVILIIIGKPFIVTLYGKKFAPSVLPFQILIASVIGITIGNILGYEFVCAGIPEIVSYCTWISGAFNILANLWAVPRFGIIGASWVSFLTYILYSLLVLLWVRSFSKQRIQDVLKFSREDITNLKSTIRDYIKNLA